MNRSWSMLLVGALAGGCATNAPNVAASLDSSAATAAHEGEEMTAGQRLVHWPVNLVLDFYDIFDLNFGTGRNDYDFGAHMQLTKLVRVGILDWADFELLGLNQALHSDDSSFWTFNHDPNATDYKVMAKLGAGAGARASIDLYQVYDWAAGVVTFNQVNPAGDHIDHH